MVFRRKILRGVEYNKMADFTVSEVVDGDTFKVKNGWKWNEQKGDTVRPTGYNTPEKGEPGYEQAKQRLKDLILGKTVDIKSAKVVDEWGRLVAPLERLLLTGFITMEKI